jgi:cytochrome c1
VRLHGASWSVGESSHAASALLLLGVACVVVVAAGCGGAQSVSTIPQSAVYQFGSREVSDGERERGQRAIQRYGCGACHVIPGVTGARGLVGPPLISFGHRSVVAGSLPNTPEHLARFIQAPQSIRPNSAMPNLDVTEGDARDIAAYLLSLD